MKSNFPRDPLDADGVEVVEEGGAQLPGGLVLARDVGVRRHDRSKVLENEIDQNYLNIECVSRIWTSLT